MLSIAITTMRRYEFLKESLPVYLAHPDVGEVIVCDETGEDTEAIKQTPFYTNSKLSLIRNEQRLGIYQNKRKALSLATYPYVAVLDSDNHFSEEWLDQIVEAIRSQKQTGKTIFASAEFKNMDVNTGSLTFPCQEFSDLHLDLKSWNQMFQRPRWNFLLNDGNWVVPRESIECLPAEIASESLQAADAIFMLQCFIKGGYAIHYLPGLSYLHIVHDGSTWLKTAKESTRILNSTNWLL